MEFYFDEERNVYVYKNEGLIEKEVIIDYYSMLGTEASLPSDLRVLIDARACTFKFEPDDLQEMFGVLRDSLKKFNSIFEAILVLQPYETVIATLFSEGVKDPRYKFGVFSTMPAALLWLQK